VKCLVIPLIFWSSSSSSSAQVKQYGKTEASDVTNMVCENLLITERRP